MIQNLAYTMMMLVITIQPVQIRVRTTTELKIQSGVRTDTSSIRTSSSDMYISLNFNVSF